MDSTVVINYWCLLDCLPSFDTSRSKFPKIFTGTTKGFLLCVIYYGLGDIGNKLLHYGDKNVILLGRLISKINHFLFVEGNVSFIIPPPLIKCNKYDLKKPKTDFISTNIRWVLSLQIRRFQSERTFLLSTSEF